ncbi:unnamed protein product [Owenia fusiformis]|uniref:Uncharacterized protein n=1 Tax=Owenia fusiformis TaxID=6347 RepID=A0A8S4QB29_OWEFU|nr:unnamed protein product [Owenia fusiformis]
MQQGLYNKQTGKLTNPSTGEELDLEEAIETGLIDAESSIVKDPTSGKNITLATAIQKGVIDAQTGSFTSEEISLDEAVAAKVVDDTDEEKPLMTLLDASSRD